MNYVVARGLVVAALATSAVSGACVDRLPDQDLRILTATPVERLSVGLLWDDYQKDRAAADSRFLGKAVVITGTVADAGSGEPGRRVLVFNRTNGPAGIRATLLDEQAATILEGVKTNPRVALKCFCEGLTDVVVLKSCVNP
jgi:hypothetical protein